MKLIDRVRILREDTASWEPHSTRRATVADLVAALIAEGGEIAESEVIGKPPLDWKVAVPVSMRGRYLVFGPIPVESAEAKETP